MRALREEAGGAGAWILAFAIASGLGLGALIGIGCAIGANACPFGGGGGGYAGTEGAALWTRNCAACHGVRGDGIEGRGPSLVSGARASLPLDALEARIARGRPFYGMPAFKRSLTAEQIRAVGAYLVSLRPRASASPSAVAS